MPYPEFLIAPMREELTRVGIEETRTPEEVDKAVQANDTVMIVVNSVCGCAAGRARPAIAMAMQHSTLPKKAITVFAGADIEATDHARSMFTGHLPSSPSVGILKSGQLVYLLERHQIEGRDASEIARDLTSAFDRFCNN